MHTEITPLSLLGIPVQAAPKQSVLQQITDWINQRSLHHYIIVANVHLLMEAQAAPELRYAFDEASLAVTDGMPLVWLARRIAKKAERIVGVEMMTALCQSLAAGGGRIFLLGGAEGVATALGSKLCADFPGLVLAGTACPPFRPLTPEEENEMLEQINQSAPDILFVAFGAPKQECWMQRHSKHLQVPVTIGVGAAFNYALGSLRRAPKWMQLMGLEWLFRLLQEPRRLFSRYFKTNSLFLIMLLRHALAGKPPASIASAQPSDLPMSGSSR